MASDTGGSVAVFLAVTAWLFVFPAHGENRPPAVLISRGAKYCGHSPCARPPQGITLTCFNPSPATTQGEAGFIARFARQHRWKSVTLVTVPPQATWARLRLERCFAGHIYVVTAPLPAGPWSHEIAYEWGATLKALLLQRLMACPARELSCHSWASRVRGRHAARREGLAGALYCGRQRVHRYFRGQQERGATRA